MKIFCCCINDTDGSYENRLIDMIVRRKKYQILLVLEENSPKEAPLKSFSTENLLGKKPVMKRVSLKYASLYFNLIEIAYNTGLEN